jgi:hypothetical protein
MICGPADRQRLRAIGQTLHSTFSEHEIRCDWVWPNLPPAWVHHVRWGQAEGWVPVSGSYRVVWTVRKGGSGAG